MAKKVIPKETQQKIVKIIDDFNKRNFHDNMEVLAYFAEFKGKFAIYKWSREQYDSDEWFFPGVEFVDGTIEGAMKAGLEAYPV